MKTFLRFLISRQFLINLALVIVLWVVIVWGFFSYIESYGRFGEKIKVPDFVGLHIHDIDDFVKDKGIDYEVIDSVYVDDLPKGTVIKQIPLPTDSTGVFVKEGRKIKLSVVPLNERMVDVPDFRSKSKAMSEILMEIIGISAKIEFQPDEAGKDFVIDQKYKGKHIPPGTKIPKGTKITLVVSKGKSGTLEVVPSLNGLTLQEAQNKISTQALTIYHECNDCVSPEDLLTAKVVKQSPGATAEVSAGSTLTVWLSVAQKVNAEDNVE